MISFLNNLSAENNISSFLTPFRWFFVVRPFAGDRIAFLLIPLALIAAVAAAAFALSARRNVGAGMVQPRKGRGNGAPGLKSEWALAWRMQRGSLLVWTLVLGVFALAIGSVDSLVAQMLRDLPVLADWMGLFGEPHEAFRVLMIYVLSLFVAAYGILATLRLRSEETDGRVDSLLSTRTKRMGLISFHAVYAIIGPVVMLSVIGLAISLGGALSGGAGLWAQNLSAALGKLPAVWVMSGIVLLLFGVIPKASVGVSWGIFGLFIALQLLWEMGAVPDALVLLSPFGQVYPSRPQSLPVSAVLTLIAALFCFIGLLGFKRRDIAD